MSIHSLSLRHFRNHQELCLLLPPHGLIITGENGSGKTSILEAIFICSALKSFRAKTLFQSISHNASSSEVAIQTDTEHLCFRWQDSPLKKTLFRKNEVPYAPVEMLKKKEFLAILFSPEDLSLPFLSPNYRRKYLNRVLVPLFPEYFLSLRKYEKILFSRNALLKRIREGLSSAEELVFYDIALAEESSRITCQRKAYIQDISPYIQEGYAHISQSSDTLETCFVPSLRKGEEQAVFTKNHSRDIARGTTSCGAHLDDFYFLLRGERLEEEGSRGEVRSTLLALKTAEEKYVRETTGRQPLLLFDDVFSELDAHRRKCFLSLAEGKQFLMTTTDVPSRALPTNSDIQIFSLPKNHCKTSLPTSKYLPE